MRLVSPITKSNSKMHLIGCWFSQIILIVTSIYKSFEIKFIVFLAFSYLNYFLWLVTHICKTHVFKVVLSLALFYSLKLLKIKEKKCKTSFFFFFFFFLNISNFAPEFDGLSLTLVGGPRRWPKWPRPRANPVLILHKFSCTNFNRFI